MSAAPLHGLRVLDFTRVLAGPHCTKLLRDLGADITKIEPPAGDVARNGVPHVDGMSLYYTQQNAGKRNLSIDLNWPEAREIVAGMCRQADVIVENFRPGTLARFGLGYEQVKAGNPGIVYVSISGYGQTGPWKSRPAFAPTIHAETGFTDTVARHYGDSLAGSHNDACSHADVYTGLHGAIAVLAALRHRERTGEGQHVDVSMAAAMLAVNERAGAQLSGIDTNDEPLALAAPDSHIYALADGRRVTIASSPVATAAFTRYCGMMRRTDLLADPRYATPTLRRQHLASILAEVRAWVHTFNDLDELQAQVSEVSLAIGVVRTTEDFAASDWAREWGAVVDVDNRAGGTARMPGAPWRFSASELPAAGLPSFQGEDNAAVLAAQGVPPEQVDDLRRRRVLLSRRTPRGAYD
ncbi:CoA transferase [Piscinibacter sakaiensis]|uniref:CAIB/BAIF family protein n=1 Tax=Piscinibacter sakaiensis TaxID=1547922 RepID=A0A0K8P286_PISS1|nr:CoA transferase [Piscinibacter sakaiensis]GAP36728.1 CAIB/BAIF family protein [Piscinibacter sakaiensis]